MVERTITENKLIMKPHTVLKKAIRMKKKMRLVSKRVPRDFSPVANCSCHFKACACVGSTDCPCAYPVCGCAPQIIHRNVEVL
jgi:hypothetical protein